MHSYRRTFLLLVSVLALEAVFWTLAGFWPRFDELGLTRWGLIVILALVVPIGTSTIRDIVAGYANLFDIFDEKTEILSNLVDRHAISGKYPRSGHE
jgi:hypothetical protein